MLKTIRTNNVFWVELELASSFERKNVKIKSKTHKSVCNRFGLKGVNDLYISIAKS